MLEGLIAANTLRRVEREELLQEIESGGRRVGVQGLELDTGLDWQRADVAAVSSSNTAINSLLGTG